MAREFFVIFVLTLTLFNIPYTRSQESAYPVFASDLHVPTKVIILPDGLVMVAEAGSGKNDGRLSLFDNTGARHTLVEGLPSAPESVPDSFSGPNSVVVRDRTMFISIGIGDVLRPGSGMQPGTGRALNPNPPSSPIFSSVLQVTFDRAIGFDLGPFLLSRSDHDQLAAGQVVTLTNADGEQTEIKLVVNLLPDALPDSSVPGFRGPDPFDLVLDGRRPDVLYVIDGGLGRVVKVDLISRQQQDFVKFDKLRKPPNVVLGPPLVDPIPTGARQQGNWLYVAFLTGFPFVQRLSQIHRVNLDTGADEVFLKDLTSSVDVEPVGENTYYVLQLSTNLLAIPPRQPAPGSLLRFDSNNAASGTVIADGLNLPNSMARHPASGEFLVVELGAGRIIRAMGQ
ncbi:MAG: ScyD/ScyE family protein [Acidobacteria bacterium]|nr:ScyD/ScyE family protein [Acidobacteriota bacterium]